MRTEENVLSEFLAQEFEDHVPDQRRTQGDGEIRSGEDIVEGEGQGLSLSGHAVEFAHQEIGIEEKDDKDDLNHCRAQRGQSSPGIRVHCHSAIITKQAHGTNRNRLRLRLL